MGRMDDGQLGHLATSVGVVGVDTGNRAVFRFGMVVILLMHMISLDDHNESSRRGVSPLMSRSFPSLCRTCCP
jgi:hypothetical protein